MLRNGALCVRTSHVQPLQDGHLTTHRGSSMHRSSSIHRSSPPSYLPILCLAGGLMAAGADPCARDKTGDTPLHLAALYGHDDTVVKLLAGEADPRLGRFAKS